jgi:hypothetical protein
MPPQNAPDFIPDPRPEFIPDAPKPKGQAAPKPQPSFWQNVKGIFNPPADVRVNPLERDESGLPAPYTLPGTSVPRAKTFEEAQKIAPGLIGFGESPMGMPRVGLPIGDVIDTGARIGRGLRSAAANTRAVRAFRTGLQGEPPPAEPIVQRLSESPNYAQILAARALARQQARQTLMPRALKVPDEPLPVGTPTNVTSSFSGSLPEPGSVAQPRLAAPKLEIPKASPLEITPQAREAAFTGSEGRPATWTNAKVMSEAAKGNRFAIEQANRRGLEVPASANTRYIMGDPDLFRAPLNPRETTRFTPEGTPIRDLARPEVSSRAMIEQPRMSSTRLSVQPRAMIPT